MACRAAPLTVTPVPSSCNEHWQENSCVLANGRGTGRPACTTPLTKTLCLAQQAPPDHQAKLQQTPAPYTAHLLCRSCRLSSRNCMRLTPTLRQHVAHGWKG